MAMAARRPCSAQGCSALVSSGRCPTHARQQDRARGTAVERGYDWRWAKFSKRWLLRHPLCGMRADGRIHEESRRPSCRGREVLAQCTDHVVPMSRGGAQYDTSNLMSLCIACNTAKANR